MKSTLCAALVLALMSLTPVPAAALPSVQTGESRSDSDLDRQRFCGSGSIGASDFKDYAAFMRFAFRGSLEGAYTTPNLGFRGARDPISSHP